MGKDSGLRPFSGIEIQQRDSADDAGKAHEIRRAEAGSQQKGGEYGGGQRLDAGQETGVDRPQVMDALQEQGAGDHRPEQNDVAQCQQPRWRQRGHAKRGAEGSQQNGADCHAAARHNSISPAVNEIGGEKRVCGSAHGGGKPEEQTAGGEGQGVDISLCRDQKGPEKGEENSRQLHCLGETAAHQMKQKDDEDETQILKHRGGPRVGMADGQQVGKLI